MRETLTETTEAHGMALTRDEALMLAFRAELDEEALPKALETKTRTDEEEK